MSDLTSCIFAFFSNVVYTSDIMLNYLKSTKIIVPMLQKCYVVRQRQGSVLGPLLSLINDICKAVPKAKVKLYGDDNNAFLFVRDGINLTSEANCHSTFVSSIFKSCISCRAFSPFAISMVRHYYALLLRRSFSFSCLVLQLVLH